LTITKNYGGYAEIVTSPGHEAERVKLLAGSDLLKDLLTLEGKRGEAFIRSIRSAMPEGRSRASFIAQAVRARLPKGLTTQGGKQRLN